MHKPVGPSKLRYLALSTKAVERGRLGPFRLEAAWSIVDSKDRYGGFSGLVALGGRRLLTVSDSGKALEFTAPDAARRAGPIGRMVLSDEVGKFGADVEAATSNRARDTVWVALEFYNRIIRLDYRQGALSPGTSVDPAAMRNWGSNSGPETLVRLADGRFLALREAFEGLFERRAHAAVLFDTDPVEEPKALTPFTFVGPRGYSPTDAALLPDGRVLVLMRRVVWPMPQRFAGVIALGDPATIRRGREWRVQVLASWQGGPLVDNFEGIAVEPAENGQSGEPLTVWLISDDNHAVLQQTILWKLELDPGDLPPRKQKGARSPRTPSESVKPAKVR